MNRTRFFGSQINHSFNMHRRYRSRRSRKSERMGGGGGGGGGGLGIGKGVMEVGVVEGETDDYI